MLGNLFGHLVPISNEGLKLFRRSSLQNERETQAPPMVVLVWSGSCTVHPRPRFSGVNKHVNFGVCLFLTGVRRCPNLQTQVRPMLCLAFGPSACLGPNISCEHEPTTNPTIQVPPMVVLVLRSLCNVLRPNNFIPLF